MDFCIFFFSFTEFFPSKIEIVRVISIDFILDDSGCLRNVYVLSRKETPYNEGPLCSVYIQGHSEDGLFDFRILWAPDIS